MAWATRMSASDCCARAGVARSRSPRPMAATRDMRRFGPRSGPLGSGGAGGLIRIPFYQIRIGVVQGLLGSAPAEPARVLDQVLDLLVRQMKPKGRHPGLPDGGPAMLDQVAQVLVGQTVHDARLGEVARLDQQARRPPGDLTVRPGAAGAGGGGSGRWAGVALLGSGGGCASRAGRLPAASSAAGPAMIRSHFRFIGM